MHQNITMSNSNKRQGTADEAVVQCITDLPDGILVGIASYLAKPSVALFAIVNSRPSTQASNAIISSIDWSVLDFGDIEKGLAAKLSDNDIEKVLESIGAVNNLQILKLAGCVNITGSGLDMLRSSIAIQQIDMSLVGKHEAPLIEPEPSLSEDIVIPIVDGIISRGSSLKQLELPKKWRSEQSTYMIEFIERYDEYLRNQQERKKSIEDIASFFEHLKDIAIEESKEGKKFVETCNNIAKDGDVEGDSLKEKLTTLIGKHHNGQRNNGRV